MNPRIDKMAREIEKTREKIAELEARLRELEQQKTDAENTEIINIFRSVDIPLGQIAVFLKTYREQPVLQAAASAESAELLTLQNISSQPTSNRTTDSFEEDQDEK